MQINDYVLSSVLQYVLETGGATSEPTNDLEWFVKLTTVANVALVCKKWLLEVVRLTGPWAWFPIYTYMPKYHKGVRYLKGLDSISPPKGVDHMALHWWALNHVIKNRDLESLVYILHRYDDELTYATNCHCFDAKITHHGSITDNAGYLMLLESDYVTDDNMDLLSIYLKVIGLGFQPYTMSRELSLFAMECGKIKVAEYMKTRNLYHHYLFATVSDLPPIPTPECNIHDSRNGISSSSLAIAGGDGIVGTATIRPGCISSGSLFTPTYISSTGSVIAGILNIAPGFSSSGAIYNR